MARRVGGVGIGPRAVLPHLLACPSFVSRLSQERRALIGRAQRGGFHVVAPRDSLDALVWGVLPGEVGRLGQGAVALPGEGQELGVGLAPLRMILGMDEQVTQRPDGRIRQGLTRLERHAPGLQGDILLNKRTRFR